MKNVSAGISERQALWNLIRFSRSRDPIIKYDSLSTLLLPVDVSTSVAGLEHRDVPLFRIISGWEWAEKCLTRLLSCVGMSKLSEWFLPFLATVASSHAEDHRLARMAERCLLSLSKERRPSRRPPRAADDPSYAATATLWKVEVTASNVWTLGVPSIIRASVLNTSG